MPDGLPIGIFICGGPRRKPTPEERRAAYDPKQHAFFRKRTQQHDGCFLCGRPEPEHGGATEWKETRE